MEGLLRACTSDEWYSGKNGRRGDDSNVIVEFKSARTAGTFKLCLFFPTLTFHFLRLEGNGRCLWSVALVQCNIEDRW